MEQLVKATAVALGLMLAGTAAIAGDISQLSCAQVQVEIEDAYRLKRDYGLPRGGITYGGFSADELAYMEAWTDRAYAWEDNDHVLLGIEAYNACVADGGIPRVLK